MMKKLPLIGLIIGAVAAAFAFMKRKKETPAAATMNQPMTESQPQDTNPPA